MKKFEPDWLTIPQFACIKPETPYHKEQENCDHEEFPVKICMYLPGQTWRQKGTDKDICCAYLQMITTSSGSTALLPDRDRPRRGRRNTIIMR